MSPFSLCKRSTPLKNMWLSPVAVTPQVGRRLRLIFDFTWNGLNNIAERLSPMEAMRFGGALLHIFKQVLINNPRLGPVYISKVDLADAYMRLWVRMEDVLSIAFLIPKKIPSDTQLVGLHLSLPMGYIDGATYFFMATETVSELANKPIYWREQDGDHPLELSAKARAADDAGAPKTQTEASW